MTPPKERKDIPAFPFVLDDIDTKGKKGLYNPGMTLRDWFAGCSLSRERYSKDVASRVKEAYEEADAMLAEREKTNGE